VATTIANFLTAAIEATAEVDNSEEIGQREMFEKFIAQLVVQVIFFECLPGNNLHDVFKV
jgi:hypothetical protein